MNQPDLRSPTVREILYGDDDVRDVESNKADMTLAMFAAMERPDPDRYVGSKPSDVWNINAYRVLAMVCLWIVDCPEVSQPVRDAETLLIRGILAHKKRKAGQ